MFPAFMFRSMQALPHQFRDIVNAFLARTGMTPARLGKQALGDPSFVSRLNCGRTPILRTADRVLVFMGEARLGPAFRAEVEAFLSVTGTKAYLLGADAVADPSFVPRLRRGSSPRLDKAQQVRDWMAAHCCEADRAAMEISIAEMLAKPCSPASLMDGGGVPRQECNDKAHQNGENEINQKRGEIPMTGKTKKFLDTREAARVLKLSHRTLDRYRVTGEGPVFHRFGNRIRYALSDLEAWAEARRVRSTSDDGLAAGRASS